MQYRSGNVVFYDYELIALESHVDWLEFVEHVRAVDEIINKL